MYRIAIKTSPYLGRAMAGFASIVALSVFLYGIFLLEAVGNTAERSSAERQIHSLTTKVGSLEAAYLEKTKDMTLARAQSLGFVKASQVTTVFANASSRSLTLRQ
jgi:hypothetical protein